MTKVQYLNTDQRTFIIQFQYKITNGNFIFQTAEDLTHILKTHGKEQGKSVKFIKEFNYTKNNFTNVNKKEFCAFLTWETEALEEIIKSEFIKKKLIKTEI